MSFRRRLLGERRDTAAWQRATLFGLMLAVAVGFPAFEKPEARAIRMNPASNAATAAEVSSDIAVSEPPDRITASTFQNIWTEPASPTWWQDVQYVAPPAGIVVDEPLIVEVSVTDPQGAPLVNTLVEVTWQLGDEQIRTSHRTTAGGRTTTRRLIPASCRDRRCLVAVRVVRDDFEGMAYSVFVPQ